MDFPRLLQDIPKYFSAGVFNDDAKAWWQSFLSTVKSQYGTIPQEKPRWPLDILKSTTTSQFVPSMEPNVPEPIAALHKSQMESRPQVPLLQDLHGF